VALGAGGIFVFLTMQFFARPMKVFLSFLGSDFSTREQVMIAWVGPRGIVAAAVTAVFALKLNDMNIEQAELLVPLAFSIIIGTVVFQSLTARPVAKLLKVAQPDTPGVLIIGANKFSILVAEALQNAGVESIICGKNWDVMLGLSNHHEYNISQVSRFRDEFGARQIFTLPAKQDPDRKHKHLASEQTTGQVLFDFEQNFSELKRAVNDGAKIHMTDITQEYDYKQWLADNPEALMLFTIGEKGVIKFKTADKSLRLSAGMTLLYLSPNK